MENIRSIDIKGSHDKVFFKKSGVFIMANDLAVGISILAGFLTYLYVGNKIMEKTKSREMGEFVILLFPAGGAGLLMGLGLYFIIKAFQ